MSDVFKRDSTECINSHASLGHSEEGEFLRVLEHTAHVQGVQEDDIEEVSYIIKQRYRQSGEVVSERRYRLSSRRLLAPEV